MKNKTSNLNVSRHRGKVLLLVWLPALYFISCRQKVHKLLLIFLHQLLCLPSRLPLLLKRIEVSVLWLLIGVILGQMLYPCDAPRSLRLFWIVCLNERLSFDRHY